MVYGEVLIMGQVFSSNLLCQECIYVLSQSLEVFYGVVSILILVLNSFIFLYLFFDQI